MVAGGILLTFHCGTKRQRIVGHLAGQLQLQVIGLELFLAGERPVKLLTHHLKLSGNPASASCVCARRSIYRTGQIDADFQLLAQRADLQLHLFAFQRVDVQRAVQRDIHRPVSAQCAVPLAFTEP
jgi:hypothetical protein